MSFSKKRILINIHYLEIGGAETSLIGLFYSIDPSLFDIDLLINDSRGELINYIPHWVNVIDSPKEYRMIERPIKEVLRIGHLKIVLSRLWAKYKFSQYFRKNNPKDGNAIFGYVGKYVTPVLPSLDYLGEYDIAISYVTPHNIVLDKINAKKKIAWIHTDYSKIDINTQIELPIWAGYDKIVSISQDVTKSFISVFPLLKNRIIEIENFLPIEIIRNRSKEFIPSAMPKVKNEISLLTIGRYCEAKRMVEIPAMAKILKDSGILFKWYIIGYGNQKELDKIKNQIALNKVDNEVLLLGKKENPYPYIKACDIYVQPSRYEGKSITVREAQMIGKPVVITNYPTASSQLQNGVDGFIGPYETEPFAEFLVKIINDKDSLDKITENLSQEDFSQLANLQKFLSLLTLN